MTTHADKARAHAERAEELLKQASDARMASRSAALSTNASVHATLAVYYVGAHASSLPTS